MPFIPTEQPKQPCNSTEHNPPSHLYLEPWTYTWECPQCWERIVYTIPLVN